eukprot:FR735445.1.p3 GENE.FR735445.1~~FR735445.1.p3  ORF type:complete len:101 (+),score=26.40 FR735445.1:543-845(+)
MFIFKMYNSQSEKKKKKKKKKRLQWMTAKVQSRWEPLVLKPTPTGSNSFFMFPLPRGNSRFCSILGRVIFRLGKSYPLPVPERIRVRTKNRTPRGPKDLS